MESEGSRGESLGGNGDVGLVIGELNWGADGLGPLLEVNGTGGGVGPTGWGALTVSVAPGWTTSPGTQGAKAKAESALPRKNSPGFPCGNFFAS